MATKKDEHMKGRKLLLVRPKLVDPDDPSKFRDGANTIVAVDTVEATPGQIIYFVRSREACKALEERFNPVDAAIVGVVDDISLADGTDPMAGERGGGA